MILRTYESLETRITDYMASQIEDVHNRQLFAYLMESVNEN